MRRWLPMLVLVVAGCAESDDAVTAISQNAAGARLFVMGQPSATRPGELIDPPVVVMTLGSDASPIDLEGQIHVLVLDTAAATVEDSAVTPRPLNLGRQALLGLRAPSAPGNYVVTVFQAGAHANSDVFPVGETVIRGDFEVLLSDAPSVSGLVSAVTLPASSTVSTVTAEGRCLTTVQPSGPAPSVQALTFGEAAANGPSGTVPCVSAGASCASRGMTTIADAGERVGVVWSGGEIAAGSMSMIAPGVLELAVAPPTVVNQSQELRMPLAQSTDYGYLELRQSDSTQSVVSRCSAQRFIAGGVFVVPVETLAHFSPGVIRVRAVNVVEQTMAISGGVLTLTTGVEVGGPLGEFVEVPLR